MTDNGATNKPISTDAGQRDSATRKKTPRKPRSTPGLAAFMRLVETSRRAAWEAGFAVGYGAGFDAGVGSVLDQADKPLPEA